MITIPADIATQKKTAHMEKQIKEDREKLEKQRAYLDECKRRKRLRTAKAVNAAFEWDYPSVYL